MTSQLLTVDDVPVATLETEPTTVVAMQALKSEPSSASPQLISMFKAHKRRSAATLVAAILLVLVIASSTGLMSFAKVLPSSGQATATAKPSTHCADEASTATAKQPFASCPSFALDFSTMADSAVNGQYFNVYTGKPEANGEAQLYTDNQQNLMVSDGSLVLRALNNPDKATDGYRYTSARVDTRGKEDFLYGKIVVRAKLPKSVGTWPAIWMLSSDEKYKSLNPASSPNHDLTDGELDIAEAVGIQPNRVYGIAHSLAHPTDGAQDYYNTTIVPGNDTAYHDYELDWTPTNLTFKIDGKAFFSIDKQAGADYRSWPYDQHYYLILNLALGGSWGGADRTHFPVDGVDSSALPATMNVQSIHYYPYVNTAR